jgi:hypothetical protein
MPKNFLHIVNSYAVSRGERPIDWGYLTDAFPLLRNREAQDGEMTVTTSVHCECTIAAHIWQNFQKHSKVFEIGTSKRSCWLCEKYLEFLIQSDSDSTPTSSTRFIVSGYQGKVHSGWKPPNGPTKALRSIIGLLRHEMDEILESVARKRQSDSFPRESLMSRALSLNQ